MLPANRWVNHANIYLLGLLVLVIGLTISKYMVGMSQFILLGNWLLELNYKAKLQKFWNNKLAVAFVSFFFLHLLSFFWSADLEYGLHDLKIKLPILILPFVLASINSLTKLHIKLVLLVFVGTTIVATFISYNVYLLQVDAGCLLDPRSLSIFISHIRFGLMIVFAIFIIVYYAFIEGAKKTIWDKILAVLAIRWLLYFLGILQTITANFIIVTILLIGGFFFLFFQKSSNKAKYGVALFMIASIIGLGVYMYPIVKGFFSKPTISLYKQTALGNDYEHYLNQKQVENGNLIWVNISEAELKTAWNNRKAHSIDYDELDALGQPIRTTLIRFLASKNLPKDALGIKKLKPHEVRAIESGFTNFKYNKLGTSKRIYEIFWSLDNYKKGGDPSGNTMAQKLEFWKNGWTIFKENPFFGVGSGDVKAEYANYYNKTNSILSENWRLRAHNQYLTFAVSFGLFGFLYFAWLLLYTLKTNYKNLLAVSLWLIVVISMFAEDTLESQAGVTFTMIFISLLFVVQPKLGESS